MPGDSFTHICKSEKGWLGVPQMVVLSTHSLTELTKQVLVKESITHLGFLKEQPKSNFKVPGPGAEVFTLLSF